MDKHLYGLCHCAGFRQGLLWKHASVVSAFDEISIAEGCDEKEHEGYGERGAVEAQNRVNDTSEQS